MELTDIGIDKWGKVFIKIQSYTQWLDSSADFTIDDTKFEGGSAKILVNDTWFQAIYETPYIKFGPYTSAYGARWIDGKVYKKSAPNYKFLYGDFATFVAGNLAVDLEGDNKCFTCIDNRIVAVDMITGADIAGIYWKTYSIPSLDEKPNNMAVLDKIKSWKINHLGLLEIKYFNWDRIFLGELPLDAIVEQIAPCMIQINKYKTVSHFNSRMSYDHYLTFQQTTATANTITKIDTFYGEFTGTTADNVLASFNILNTQVFKNVYGEITIGELIITTGKKTKPALH